MPAVLFQTILRHSAACVGMRFPEWDGAVRDQLALSQMFARTPDG